MQDYLIVVRGNHSGRSENKYMRFYSRIIALFITFNFLERVQFTIIHKLVRELSFSEILYAFGIGLRFDFAVASFFSFCIYIAYYLEIRFKKLKMKSKMIYICFFFSVVLSLVYIADTIYYFDSGRHLGYEGLVLFSEPTMLIQTGLLQYWYVFLIHIPFLVLYYSGFRYLLKKTEYPDPRKKWQGLLIEGRFILLFFVTALGITGGFQMPRMGQLVAAQMDNFRQSAIALNGAYNFLYVMATSARGIPEIGIQSGMDADTRASVIKDMYRNVSPVKTKINFDKYNVVLFFLESWSSAKIDKPVNNQDVTPFFNLLKKKSLTVRAMFAGGHRTTEGVFATLCSAQNPLGKSIVKTQLELYEYRCLPGLLKEAGYKNIFFQGTPDNLAGMSDLVKKLGFEESYGRSDAKIKKYPDGLWGLQDHDIYQLALEKMRSSPEPFFIGLNTNSTHNFYLPKGVPKKFPADSPMLNLLHFADEQLAEFFLILEKEKFFSRTIFIFVADHTNYVRSSRINEYLIPFLIYAPGILKPQRVDRVATQRDIAPTLLDILGYPEDIQFFSGKSLLRSSEHPYFAEYYHEGTLGWVENNLLIEIPVGNPNKLTCESIKKDIHKPEGIPCLPEALDARKRAIAFTTTMQHVLFAGRTTSFRSFP